MSSVLDKLKGKLITQIWLSEEKDFIKLVTDQGDFVFHAYGDCCSNSWFETVEGAENLIGEFVRDLIEKPEIQSIEIWESAEWKAKGYDPEEEIKIYGFSLVTEKGYCDIEMRNSSNGYYGGSIIDSEDKWDWPKESNPKFTREILCALKEKE